MTERQIAKAPVNVAVLFSEPLPATYAGRPVIDGDESDVRFFDAPGSIVGLSVKGGPRVRKLAARSGFAV
jgi:hypothetical protein